MAHGFPLNPLKPWKERIRHFTWAWHAVIMGTGITSALITNFPYSGGAAPALWLGFAVFALNLILFVFVCGCTIARYTMFPEVWGLMLSHPAQSLFIGCFPMGAATLINGALALNQARGWGGNALLYTLWGFWWLDSLVSYVIAFGMLYIMIVRQEQSLAKMTAVWLLPVVTLIVASSTGGLLAKALLPHSTKLALITTTFSLVMVLIGLSFALMIITVYLLRLITYGTPDITLILSSFIVLGPLGQGGYSLLLNGENMSELLPLHYGADFPFVQQSGQIPFLAQSGQMIFVACLAGSFILWAMGIAWIIVAVLSIFSVARKGKIPFSMAYWGMVFPHGTFASLSVKLALVLDSSFYRAFGGLWCCVVFSLWLWMFTRSIPAFIDGSLFKAPYVSEEGNRRKSILEIEKGQDTPVGDFTCPLAKGEKKPF
ncbi:voltage-dependent anion channel [Thelephora terrestris]|uniref:Voltage-dependent anion channel n=1 Tax=Thelephora terrestris TaxID=56493 RepID=A0A9P6L0J0_9AGAM|nr:voltage-dependent anion channel [Thelephora terrestris]